MREAKVAPPKAIVALTQLTQRFDLPAERLQHIYCAILHIRSTHRDELLKLLAQNPNIDDELFETLLQQFPTSAVHNPMIPLRILENPGWARELIGYHLAFRLIHYGHPAALFFVGPPDRSWSLEKLQRLGGFPGRPGNRATTEVERIDLWDWSGETIVRLSIKASRSLVTRGLHDQLTLAMLNMSEWSPHYQQLYSKHPVAFLNSFCG